MKKVILLYSCDAWHSWDSHRLMGVFTSRRKLRGYLRVLKRKKKLTEEDLFNLKNLLQTQGKKRNYRIEENEVNPKYLEE